MQLSTRRRRAGVYVTEPISAIGSVESLHAAEALIARDANRALTLMRGPARTFWVELRHGSEVAGTEASLPMAEAVAALLLEAEPFAAVRDYLNGLAVEWRAAGTSILDDDPESIRRGAHPALARH